MTKKSMSVRLVRRHASVVTRTVCPRVAALASVIALCVAVEVYGQSVALPALSGGDWVVQDRVTCEVSARVATQVNGEVAVRDQTEVTAPWTLASEVSRELDAPAQDGEGKSTATVIYRRARVTSPDTGELTPLALEGKTFSVRLDVHDPATAIGSDAVERALVARDRLGYLLALGGASIGQHAGGSWAFTDSEWRALGGGYIGDPGAMECHGEGAQDQGVIVLCRGDLPESGGRQEARVSLALGPGAIINAARWQTTTSRRVSRPAPTPGEEIVTEESRMCVIEATQVAKQP